MLRVVQCKHAEANGYYAAAGADYADRTLYNEQGVIGYNNKQDYIKVPIGAKTSHGTPGGQIWFSAADSCWCIQGADYSPLSSCPSSSDKPPADGWVNGASVEWL